MGTARSMTIDDGLDGADSGCMMCLDEMLSPDSGGLRDSRSDVLRMRGRRGKADSHSLLLLGDVTGVYMVL